jgi:mitochondrial chaperone BCS1
LTEENLILFFNSLPRRCILLLEDIDTMGLLRTPRVSRLEKVTQHTTAGHNATSQKAVEAAQPEIDIKEVVANDELQAAVAASKESPHKNSMTLSGLLNAISRVACQEGRILIIV